MPEVEDEYKRLYRTLGLNLSIGVKCWSRLENIFNHIYILLYSGTNLACNISWGKKKYLEHDTLDLQFCVR